MTWIEVIDTAVKIGLGALITGLLAVALAKRGHVHELTKERSRRRRELLETVAEEVEQFSHVLMRYWAKMATIVNLRDRDIDVDADQLDDMPDAHRQLFNAFGSLTSAEAKLLLLGEKHAPTALRTFGDAARAFRRKAHPENPSLTEQQMSDFREELLGAREVFFEALAAAYRTEAV